MVAEQIGQNANGRDGQRSVDAGRVLVEMALSVDLVFAAELARFCGAQVWGLVRASVGQTLRAWYAVSDEHHKTCALAGMLASGSPDFQDVLVPILSSPDRQRRFSIRRLWDDVSPGVLGQEWQRTLRSWSEDARADFIYDLLHHRSSAGLVEFVLTDPSLKVRAAAISGLEWIGAATDLIRVFECLNQREFEQVVRESHLDLREFRLCSG